MNTAPIAALSRQERLTIAVSGGVDSMTLAHVAHRPLGQRARVVHAMSPAVPSLATARVRAGWRLDLVGAADFDDPRYRSNTVNRCFFCKPNLYATIADLTKEAIALGTRGDDLGDFSSGIEAARQWQVVHPYVEARLDKSVIYARARGLRLNGLATLSAQRCLVSPVETGIAVDPNDLTSMDNVETLLRADLGMSATVRCRITHAGVVVETQRGPPPASIAEACLNTSRNDLGHRPYRRGAAFLRVQS